jgi:murein tripeptide amidase MpaA
MVSFIIEYIIDFLLGNSMLAKILRDNFIFKIVPMLNIDGVIIGNYRCNTTGADLNRQWLEPSRKLYPTIYNTKLLIKKTKEERELLLYIDLHGHSRKKNAFMCNQNII